VVNLRSELRKVDSDIGKLEAGLKGIEKRLEEACSGKIFVNSRKCQALLDEQVPMCMDCLIKMTYFDHFFDR
jgi:hypothetical protein